MFSTSKTLLAALSFSLLACAGSARADSSAWPAALHAEAMAKLRDYANTTFSKVMVACIHWPETVSGTPTIAYVTTNQTELTSRRQLPVNQLRMVAMRNCLGRAGASGCDCAVLDENGRNVLRVPAP